MDLQLNKKPLTDTDFQERALSLTNRLLDEYSGIESYILVKQLINTLEYAIDNLKEKAILSCPNDERMLGAECKIAYRKKYEYDSNSLKELLLEEEEIKSKIKSLKKVLELSGESGYVSQSTGVIEYAKEISQQAVLTIKFNKR